MQIARLSVLVTLVSLFTGTGFAADLNATLTATHEAYIAQQPGLYGEQGYQFVGGRVRFKRAYQLVSTGLDLGGGTATHIANYHWLYVPEAWVRFERTTGSVLLPNRFTVGRKKEAWSKLDEDWQLGVWQPMFRWDPLRPEAQGLSGVFLGWVGESAELTLFYSGLFLPEQGPPYSLDNGTISSPSPWFSEPTNSLILFSQPVGIRYQIQTPPVRDIVAQQSYGASLLLGRRERGPWTSLAYADKPRNTLALPFDASLELTPASGSNALVVVYPRVERHRLVAFDGGYAAPRAGLFFASLAEFPQLETPDPLLTQQRLPPQYLFSPGIEGRPFATERWAPKLSLSYLFQRADDPTEIGPGATNRGAVLSARTNFSEALSLVASSQLSRRLSASMHWIEDFGQHGTLVMCALAFRPNRNWTVALNGDFLGSTAPVTDQTGLINRFRGNDRISTAVTYLF